MDESSHARLATKKSVVWGVLGSLVLFAVYLIVLSVLNSLAHAWEQYLLLWPWMTALVLGFGLQVGLFVYMRAYHAYAKTAGAVTGTVAATGGVSVGSMAACCLHHVTDVLPVLGLSAAAVFLVEFQTVFLGFGIVSSVAGMAFMLHTMRKHGVYFRGGFMQRLMQYDWWIVFGVSIAAGVLWLTWQVLLIV